MKIKFLLAFAYSFFNIYVYSQCNLMATTVANNAMGGGANGSVTLSVSGGTPPYTYAWSSGQTTQNINLLPPGCYSVMITDAAGCSAMASSCLVNQAGPILFSNSNPVSTFTVVNGGFTPQWVCANQTLQTDGGIMKIYLESGATMITGGGIDTVYAKTGSTITMTGGIHVIYHEPGVTLNMNGGIPTLYPCPSLAFNYSLAPAGGCAPVLTCNLAVALSVGNTIGGGNNGSINTTVSNGTFPFTYAWSTGQTTSSLNNLNPGAYSVIVTDANGCVDTAAANLINLAGPTVLSNSNVVSSYQVVNGGFTPQWVCPNDTLYTDGGIMNIYLESGATMITGGGIDSIFAKTGSTIIMNGGIHRIYHEPGVNLVMNGGIPYLFPCPSLVFNYSQAPANGCVPVPVCNLSASISNLNNVNCFGGMTGSAIINASNGTAPYNVSWSGPVNGNPIGNEIITASGSYSITGLASGSYTATITDANSCTTNTTYTVNQPTQITLASAPTNINCFGELGLSLITATGGVAPYNITYSGPVNGNPPGIDINNSGGSYTIINLNPGSYSVSVTDANGCSAINNFTITTPPQISITTVFTDELMGLDGTATASVSGGIAPYTYLWTPSGQTGANATGLAAGTYNLNVTDANGCTESTQVQVGSQVGLNENGISNKISLYPNPATEQLYINRLMDNDPTEINIYSIDGQLVSTLNFTSGKVICLSVDQWSTGVYHVHVKSASGTYTMPFVKQ